MLSNWSKLHIPSEKLGLTDHQRRDNWRQDAAATMAEIQQRGWSQTYAKYISELSKVESMTLLVPGMPAEAFMQTDKRSVMNYLLKPATDQLNRAFREE